MKLRILFADGDPGITHEFRGMLQCIDDEWTLAFASSGHDALAQLAHEPFDVVVADTLTPEMDGAALLSDVKTQYPDIIRILLCPASNHPIPLKAVEAAHQILLTPLGLEALITAIGSPCALREALANSALRQVVTQIDALPSLPSVYTAVMEQLRSSDPSAQKVGELIAQDLAMSAKILQIVNSALFSLPRQVASPVQATQLLGLDTIANLVLSAKVFSAFDQARMRSLSIDALWAHSMTTATWAKAVAKAEGANQSVSDHAFTAGLLHDIGKLILAANCPDQYREVIARSQGEGISPADAETGVFGVTHAEVGAYLLDLWGLPAPILEAVAFHHAPSASMDEVFSPLTAVHVANALHRQSENSPRLSAAQPLDHEYLINLGLHHRIPEWLELGQGLGVDREEVSAA